MEQVMGPSELSQEPMVTIILTTLNSDKFLARAIDSCLNQTYENLELIVVDGGSTDGTLDILVSYTDPRIRLFHQKDNVGKLPGAINLGMENSRGEFITWTQDDCWYELNAVPVMVEYLKLHLETALVYADYWFVDEQGHHIRLQTAGDPAAIADGGDIIGQCFLFRREVYETIGPQDERYFPVHEVPWRIRVARCFGIEPLHHALMYYTLHKKSLTGKIGPWQLRYMVADALLEERIWDRRKYRQQVAKLHVDHAYDEFFLQGNYLRFWKYLSRASRLNPQTLKNRGTWKLMLASLLPNRESFRQNTLKRWKTVEATRKQKQREDVNA